MWLQVRVQNLPFDWAQEEAQLRAHTGLGMGALVGFQGMVRAHDQATALTEMHLEHYPGVTEAEITRIAQHAAQRWQLQACSVTHRVGLLLPGEAIVLVLVAAAHRQSAFDSAQYIMDYLKTEAPFWKREVFADGSSRWVEAKCTDAQAVARWQTAPAS